MSGDSGRWDEKEGGFPIWLHSQLHTCRTTKSPMPHNPDPTQMVDGVMFHNNEPIYALFPPIAEQEGCGEPLEGLTVGSAEFIAACVEGREESVVSLLDSQSAVGNEGDSAGLRAAMANGHADLVALILARCPSADPHAANSSGIVYMLAGKWGGRGVKALLSSPSFDPSPPLFLHSAVWHGDLQDVKALLSSPRVDVNVRSPTARYGGKSALEIAVRRNHSAIVDLLLASGALPPDASYSDSDSNDDDVQPL